MRSRLSHVNADGAVRRQWRALEKREDVVSLSGKTARCLCYWLQWRKMYRGYRVNMFSITAWRKIYGCFLRITGVKFINKRIWFYVVTNKLLAKQPVSFY